MAASGQSKTSIDLFAGCGGLTRGLEWAGFETLAFNELNKDAADSFSANFPASIRMEGDIRDALSEDLIENELLPLIEARGGLGFLCGGPPCQGYSGIGHRRTHAMSKRDIPTNHLYEEMIRAIRSLKPSVFLFENVEGILTSAWYDFSAEKNLVKKWKKGESHTMEDLRVFAESLEIDISSTEKKEMLEELEGSLAIVAQEYKKIHRGEIFRTVLKSFSEIEGYTAQPTLIHSYGFGVPQNRPRVMIMGIKNEIVEKLELSPSVFDPDSKSDSYSSQLRNNGGFFPIWDEENVDAPDLVDLLSDLDFEGWSSDSPYYKIEPVTPIQQFLREGVQTDEQGREILTDHEFSNHTAPVVERFQFMLDNGVTKKEDLPERMRTKKFNQRPLPPRWEDKPMMTVTSLPDDYVHYSRPRTFSVREWARMQTFPDKHVFCGNRTTGGERRAGNPTEGNWDRDLPKYTQVGNAVPPLLAKAIGETIGRYLDQFNN